MRIKWLGHACFLITSNTGIKILTDPYDDSIGYRLGEVLADIVTVSHDHFDHNYTRRVTGSPQIINKQGRSVARGIEFQGIPSFHDKTQGRQRGSNLIFKFKVDDINICHLGDLGHTLPPAQINQMGEVDVLLLPVGGVYTIDAPEATQLSEAINPKVIIPMHYKTDVLTLGLAKVDEFIKGKSNVKKQGSAEVELKKDTLPTEKQIIVLEYTLKP